MTIHTDYDVIVVGGGNAGFSAAHAARETGRSVLLLEAADEDSAGGNTFYTAGALRFPHRGLADLLPLLDPDDRHATTVVPAYTAEMFRSDLARVTDGRSDPAMVDVLLRHARSTIDWLHGMGMPLRLMYERQAYQDDRGEHLFWGGLHAGVSGGGKAMAAFHRRTAERSGVEVAYGHRVERLIMGDGRVVGVEARVAGHERRAFTARRVVLAAGGFQASPGARAEWLGEAWRQAFVRGVSTNDGTVLRAALAVGAAPHGDFTTCHSVAWDADAKDNQSNRELTNRLTRGGYPLGIVVDVTGRRFFDEGEDFRNLTYAKLGAAILRRPRGRAYQIFDAQTRPLLRTEEYDMPGATEIVADDLGDLARKAGIDAEGLQRTVREFNAAVDTSRAFAPSILDGRRSSTTPPKGNWALELSTPPFHAFAVGTGITFTFGGLHVDDRARVLDGDASPIPGLHAAGEIVGGLFSGNYPGGSGLTAGAVYGRLAGGWWGD